VAQAAAPAVAQAATPVVAQAAAPAVAQAAAPAVAQAAAPVVAQDAAPAVARVALRDVIRIGSDTVLEEHFPRNYPDFMHYMHRAVDVLAWRHYDENARVLRSADLLRRGVEALSTDIVAGTWASTLEENRDAIKRSADLGTAAISNTFRTAAIERLGMRNTELVDRVLEKTDMHALIESDLTGMCGDC